MPKKRLFLCKTATFCYQICPRMLLSYDDRLPADITLVVDPDPDVFSLWTRIYAIGVIK